MSQAGRDGIATDKHRKAVGPDTNAHAATATADARAAASTQRRARQWALLLMVASAALVLGCIPLLYWWFT